MRQVKDGKVPQALRSHVELDGWSDDTYFDFNVIGNTCRSPLWRLRKILQEDLVFRGKASFKGENDVIRGQVAGDWLADLKGQALPGVDWVSSHGVTFHPEHAFEVMKHEDAESVAATHYLYRDFFRVHGRQLLICESRLTRAVEHRQAAEENVYLDPMAADEGIRMIMEDSDGSTRDGRLPFCTDLKYLVAGNGETIQRVVNRDVRIAIDPALDAAGAFMLRGSAKAVEVRIELPDALVAEKVTFAGIVDRVQAGHFSREAVVTVELQTSLKGIVPLLVMVEGRDWVAWKHIDVLVLPSAITTPDHRANGALVEAMRSILMRRIYNVLPEEEPRGEMRFPLVVCGRFLAAANCAYFGFEELGEAVIGAFGDILKRDGYLHQDVRADGSVPDSGGHFSFGKEGNDGLGFFLFQLGKMMLRNPAFDFDYDAVMTALEHLEQNTHYNGLLDSQSEPEDFMMSEVVSGNPYTQGIVIAGLRVLQNALKGKGYMHLVARCNKLERRLVDGLQALYKESGYFSNRIYSGFGSTGYWSEKPYLSSYTALGPGMFMKDPEADVQGFDGLIDRSIEEVEKRCLVPGRPLVMGDLTCVCFAYSQYGIIANLLGLNRLSEAEPYLNAALDYWNTTTMTYILPEMVFTGNRDWWGEFDVVEEPKRLRAFFPWLFEGNQPVEGVFGLIRDSGNLCPVSHLLYLVDLIVGVAHVGDHIKVLPKVFPGWQSDFKVEQLHTAWGPVSYSVAKGSSELVIQVEKPEGKMHFYLDGFGIEGKQVYLNDAPILSGDLLKDGGSQCGIELPFAQGRAEIRVI